MTIFQRMKHSGISRAIHDPVFFPVTLVVLFCVMTYFFELCFELDGASFSLQNFFDGGIANPNDFTRYASILGTHLPSLLYNWLGGKDYSTSATLFNFGHNFHVLIPVIYLLECRLRYPGEASWVRRSLILYVLCLFTYRGLSYLFVASEVNFAHSLSWTLIFSFRFQQRVPQDLWHRRIPFVLMSVTLLFTYPISFFTYLFLVAAITAERPRPVLRDWRWFLGFLAVLEVLLILGYEYLYPNSIASLVDLRVLKVNRSVLGLPVVLFLFFGLRPFFLLQNYLLALLLALIYGSGNLFAPWHSFNARPVSVLVIIFFQAFYLLAADRFSDDTVKNLFTKTIAPYLLFLGFVLGYQGQLMMGHAEKILQVAESERAHIDAQRLERILGNSLTYFQHKWNIRGYSARLQLQRHNRLYSVMTRPPSPESYGSYLGNWDTEKFRLKFAAMGLVFPDHIMVPKEWDTPPPRTLTDRPVHHRSLFPK